MLSEGRATSMYDEWSGGKKTGNVVTHINIPNKYFFVCVEGLIRMEEIPEYAGLIYVNGTSFTEIKPAKFIHKHKANQRIYERVATILSQRIIFGCSFYTFKHKIK